MDPAPPSCNQSGMEPPMNADKPLKAGKPATLNHGRKQLSACIGVHRRFQMGGASAC
jgi:hypothetical protein